jgi:transposase InsO family protein
MMASHQGEVEVRDKLLHVAALRSNAVIESWHSTLEFELRGLERFATKAAARTRIAAWIDEWNHRRLHGEINMIPPIEMETLYYAQPPDLAEAGAQ